MNLSIIFFLFGIVWLKNAPKTNLPAQEMNANIQNGISVDTSGVIVYDMTRFISRKTDSMAN